MNTFINTILDLSPSLKVYCLIPLLGLAVVSKIQAQDCEGEIGMVIFSEDFGSGAGPGPELPPGTTTYNYGSIGNGNYVVTNTTGLNGSLWHNAPDHTPGDTDGYCLLFDASFETGVFYARLFEDLCANTNYTFSCFVTNLVTPTACGGNSIEPDLKFSLLDPVTMDELGSVTTGGIPTTSEITWIQYSFSFTTGPAQMGGIIQITNNAPGGCGNDLAIDDLSFSICNPFLEQEFDLCTLPGNVLQVGDEIYDSPGFYETIIDIPNSCHDSIVYTTLTGSGPVNTDEFLWICQGDSINIGGNFYSSDTLVIDTISPPDDCIETISYTLDVGLYAQTSEQIDLCVGDSLFVAGEWVFDNGIYVDTFQSIQGCDSFHLTELEFWEFELDADFPQSNLAPGETYQVFVSSNSIAGNYEWMPPEFFSCATCPDPLFTPLESGSFSVSGFDPVSGCADTLQFNVVIDPCRNSFIPNVFSPDQDGVNDYFQPFLSNCVVNISTFQIYDRWGNAVHVQDNIPVSEARWDGRCRNKDAAVGVYAYYIEAQLFDGGMILFKGDVTLIR